MAQKRGRGDDEDELEGGYAGAGVSDEIKVLTITHKGKEHYGLKLTYIF